VKETENY